MKQDRADKGSQHRTESRGSTYFCERNRREKSTYREGGQAKIVLIGCSVGESRFLVQG